MLFLVPSLYAADAVPRPVPEAAAPGESENASQAKKTEETKAPEPFTGILEFSNVNEIKVEMKCYAGEMRIVEIAPHGSMVARGAVVAKISAADMADALIEAKTNLDVLESALKSLKEEAARRKNDDGDELERTKHSLDVAEEALERWNTEERADAIRGMELALEGRQNSIEDQKDELAQLEKLYQGNELAKESQDIVLRRARRELKRSEEYYALEKKRNERFLKFDVPNTDKEKKYAVQNAKQALIKLETEQSLGHPDLKAQISNTENSLRQARRRIEKLSNDSIRLTFKAPFDGIVIMGAAANTDGAVKFKPGDKIAPDTIIASVSNPSMFSASFKVPPKTAIKIKPGMEAGILAEALDVTIPCVVSSLGIDAKDNKVTVVVQIRSSGVRLFPGMSVKLTLPPE
jgi:hypothetical protein